MKKYLINYLEDNYDALITLLDYQTKISTCLKSIKNVSGQRKRLLVDTALCSGMNGYRFIEFTLNEYGTINLDNYNYVILDNNTLIKSNEILKNYSNLENSVLTEYQIKEIKQNY